jgi:hypothetical protein
MESESTTRPGSLEISSPFSGPRISPPRQSYTIAADNRLYEDLKSLPERLANIRRSGQSAHEKDEHPFFGGVELTSTSYEEIDVKNDGDGINAQKILEKVQGFVILSFLDSFELGIDKDLINPWEVSDTSGNVIYYVGESYRGALRNCFRQNRPFRFNVLHTAGYVMFHIVRKCNLPMCCFGSRLLGNNALVTSSTHKKLGFIEQKCSGRRGEYVVRDETGEALFNIEEEEESRKRTIPWRVFDITEIPSQKQIGSLINRLPRLSVPGTFDILSSAEYTLSFPDTLKPDHKVILLGAAFCMIITYLEPGGPEGEYSDKCYYCAKTGGCIASVVFLLASTLLAGCVLLIYYSDR